MNPSESGTPEVRAGLILGRYELLVPIAAGGMAQVWAARLRGARSFQKIVAVKTMLPKLSEDAQFEQMFLDEASLASQIRHPNAVEIMDLGEHSGILYLVMEWIEGVPLNQLMKAAKAASGIPFAVAARIAMHACAGLHAAHELKDEKGNFVGLVHRDVSPQNLLVTFDGVTKVVDFGVAKATALGGGATVAGQVKGKASYMAPEQVNGEGLDRRADVFALGIVLYALTTGKHPFRRESEAATMYAICAPEPVLAPSRVVPNYPPEIEPIVLKALEKDRNKRFASCDEMLRALDSLPAHLRLSSDGDVGAFVQSLFAETRIEQKRKIEDAMVRVDTAPHTALWAGDVPSQVDGRRSLASTTGMQELSGIPASLRSSASRNRWFGMLGLAALAISGGVLFNAVSRPKDVPPAPAARVLEAPEPARVEPTPVPTPAPVAEPSAPAVDIDALPDDAPVHAVPKTTTTTTPRPKTSTTTKTPVKQKSSDFKMDAGF